MDVTQQAFAEAVIAYVESSRHKLEIQDHESEAPDLWTYWSKEQSMSGATCLVHHGLFDQVYRRQPIMPQAWDKFCEQFYSPEARLLLSLWRECKQSSWLVWDRYDDDRDDFPMTEHFWTRTHQNNTYDVLRSQLHARRMVTAPTRSYKDDPRAFGVKLPGRVVDFPGSYRTLDYVVSELLGDLKYDADIPRGIKRYGQSQPVLHMVSHTVELSDNKLDQLVAEGTSPTPKPQVVLYVLSESRDSRLTPRHVGYMSVSVLEIAYGTVAGAVHHDRSYLVPNDLSPDEQQSYDCSATNWRWHHADIIKQCPPIAQALGVGD